MIEGLHVDRRDLLGHALLLVGAAASASFSAEALAAAASGGKRYLAKSPFTTLSALADTMIPVTDTPGALAAGVPETLDAMLAHWASAPTRELITGGLARIDAAAIAQQGKAFAAIAPQDRLAFLVEHDKAALKAVPPPPGAKPAHPFAPLVSVADNGYHRLKDLVITLYYASEIGMTRELVYEHVPGEWVPSLKITPGMRPFAGTGPF